ncbi:MAG TPA: heme ABC exporter ATP-binding protein CcmA [Acidimicrobiales bacterium]|nr:heme ABC exporter ATP-binding protein CcmA [Acidimicrobiales bacterium]
MVDAVRLRSVVALAGRFPLLAGADLSARPGEVVLLRGPNGAGKTSLLRVCAGLLAVTSGQATVLGEDLLADRRGIRRRVGLLAHATHLYDDLTVAENVRFFVRAAGLPGDAAAPALARLGLTGRLADLPASRLSAGQRRRAALAVIAAREPELWLLDEPHAGLDAGGRELVDELVAAAARRGAAVVMASHEGGAVEELAHRTVVVSGGRSVEQPVGSSLTSSVEPAAGSSAGSSAGPDPTPGGRPEEQILVG